jgi:hypothetical protein
MGLLPSYINAPEEREAAGQFAVRSQGFGRYGQIWGQMSPKRAVSYYNFVVKYDKQSPSFGLDELVIVRLSKSNFMQILCTAALASNKGGDSFSIPSHIVFG